MINWAIRFFKWVGSLRFAVVTILLLATVIGAGTFIESYHGTEAAQITVYRTPWFGFLLIALAMNLLASALDRIPWKKKHIGFLTTHLGIILILFGSFVTARLGIEGQLAVEEGETAGRMTLSKPILKIMDATSKEVWTFHPRERAFAWSGREELVADEKLPFPVYLLHDYPKAKVEEVVRETKEGVPAIHAILSGTMANSEQWLFLGKAGSDEVALGPATLKFSSVPFQTNPGKKSSEFGSIEFSFTNGKSILFPVKLENISKSISLDGAPYPIKVTVSRILKNALVEENKLIDKEGEWKNPAIEFLLEGKGAKERHTVFSNFPEFPSVHGMKDSEIVSKATYRFSEMADDAQNQNELRFVYEKGALPKYQIKHRGEIKEGVIEIGKSVATGWMDFQFTVDHYYEHAEGEKVYSPLESSSARKDAVPAIEIEFKKNEGKKEWLSQGSVAEIPEEGLEALYGLETKPLGFQIKLKDFMIDKDPGTEKPASFKSNVTLKDVSRGIERDVTIQMNQPLIYRGFKVYQSAYQLVKGRPDISIFTVARDPGLLFKYAGAIILVGGILLLFYVKPLSTLKTSDPKTRER